MTLRHFANPPSAIVFVLEELQRRSCPTVQPALSVIFKQGVSGVLVLRVLRRSNLSAVSKPPVTINVEHGF